MKRNDCDAFAEEFGAYIGSGVRLGGGAAAHLRECARCQEKVAVAKLQEEVAAQMPEPKRRLHRRQLERLLAKKRGGIGWMRPALIGFAAVLILAAVAVLREQDSVPPEASVLVSRTEENSAETTVSAPTILALRQELENGREMLASAPISGAMKHYRVRDVQMELRN
jgi:hypothetical protein